MRALALALLGLVPACRAGAGPVAAPAPAVPLVARAELLPGEAAEPLSVPGDELALALGDDGAVELDGVVLVAGGARLSRVRSVALCAADGRRAEARLGAERPRPDGSRAFPFSAALEPGPQAAPLTLEVVAGSRTLVRRRFALRLGE